MKTYLDKVYNREVPCDLKELTVQDTIHTANAMTTHVQRSPMHDGTSCGGVGFYTEKNMLFFIMSVGVKGFPQAEGGLSSTFPSLFGMVWHHVSVPPPPHAYPKGLQPISESAVPSLNLLTHHPTPQTPDLSLSHHPPGDLPLTPPVEGGGETKLNRHSCTSSVFLYLHPLSLVRLKVKHTHINTLIQGMRSLFLIKSFS